MDENPNGNRSHSCAIITSCFIYRMNIRRKPDPAAARRSRGHCRERPDHAAGVGMLRDAARVPGCQATPNLTLSTRPSATSRRSSTPWVLGTDNVSRLVAAAPNTITPPRGQWPAPRGCAWAKSARRAGQGVQELVPAAACRAAGVAPHVAASPASSTTSRRRFPIDFEPRPDRCSIKTDCPCFPALIAFMRVHADPPFSKRSRTAFLLMPSS